MIIRFANCTCCCPSACCAGLVYCARCVMYVLSEQSEGLPCPA